MRKYLWVPLDRSLRVSADLFTVLLLFPCQWEHVDGENLLVSRPHECAEILESL